MFHFFYPLWIIHTNNNFHERTIFNWIILQTFSFCEQQKQEKQPELDEEFPYPEQYRPHDDHEESAEATPEETAGDEGDGFDWSEFDDDDDEIYDIPDEPEEEPEDDPIKNELEQG